MRRIQRKMQEDKAKDLYKRLKGIQNRIINEEFVLSARSPKGTSKVEVMFEGTREDLMGALAHIVDGLKENSNLSDDDIMEAVELGLRGLEACKEDIRDDLKELMVEMGIFDD